MTSRLEPEAGIQEIPLKASLHSPIQGWHELGLPSTIIPRPQLTCIEISYGIADMTCPRRRLGELQAAPPGALTR